MKPKHPTPPAWALRFFTWYCNDHLADAALGDMLELYARRCQALGKRKADLLFAWNVMLFFQPFAIRKQSTSVHLNHLAMFQNNFKISWRSMLRQKMYTAIKIGGFALGLATCIVIALFIRHELSYDKHYKDAAYIYRLYNEYNGPEKEKWLAVPAAVASIIKNEYPEVENTGRLIPYNWYNAGNNLFRRDENPENTYEEGFAYADQSLLEILEIPLIYGNPHKALASPNTMVLSKSKADKYFPNENPVGKIILLNDDATKPYTIGGVMDDAQPAMHIHYDFLITLAGVEFWPGEQTSWCCWNYNVYVKLRHDANPRLLEKKLLAMRDTYYVGYLRETGNQNEADVKKYYGLKLQPVQDIYLRSAGLDTILPQGDIRYVWLFGGIACFILLLACINFINLSTARSANRAKEVGLRKVVGSVRSYLVRQFLTESLLYSFISFILALVMVILALPYFNALAGKTLLIPWAAWWFFPVLISAAVITGLLAGIYPALYLSSFKPIDVLKGNISRGMKGSTLRSAMVVFQFTTSIALIIGTITIYRQMNFILHTKIGFEKEQVIMIQGANTLDQRQETFKNELLKLAHVQHVTISQYLPVAGTKRDHNLFWRDGKSKEEKSVGAQRWYVDVDYFKTMGMKLVEGRNFNPDLASDSQAIIINQAMVKAFGFKKPIGERIMNRETYHVIGVVEDFHFESMKGEITPLSMVFGKWGNIISVKVDNRNMKGVIEAITQRWNTFMPHQPLRYSFLDESYARMYDDVQRTGNIFASFAILAIIVACLGLFALSAFMVEQRTKEISIRLVLGASMDNIFRLLTQNFMLLVLISFSVAVPLAWYVMQLWLQDFKYKTEITWDIFVIAGVLSALIALLTISYQSVAAALANPAAKLRSE